MTVIAMKRTTFDVTQYNGVSAISFGTTNITITHSGGTATLVKADWIVQIIND